MAVVTLTPYKDATIANVSWYNWYVYQDGTRNSSQIGFWDWYDRPNAGLYAYQGRALQQYALPALPVGASIISAKLRIYMWGGSTPSSWNERYVTVDNNPTIEVRRILQEWDEGTGTGFIDGRQYTGATWSNRTKNGYGWSAWGGYIDGTPVAERQQSRGSGWWEFDVKSLVDYWYANPANNFGLMVKFKNDQVPAGGMWMQTREDGNTGTFGPQIVIEYNTPPEQPRGLSPNFGSFICQDLAHSMHFKWTFVDTAAPLARGKTDVVFLVNTNPSMQSRLSFIRQQIVKYMDRMDGELVNWNIGLVAFGSVLASQPVKKFGMYSNRTDVLNAFDSLPRYAYTSYQKSGLEAVMDASQGALSFLFRAQSKIQFLFCSDAPFHDRQGLDGYYVNGSLHTVTEVVTMLNNSSIPTSMSTNTHCGSYTQLRQFPLGTNGQYLEEGYNWGDQFNILTIRTEDEEARSFDGDYQSKATLRIWKIETNGARTLIGNPTFTGTTQDISLKGLGIPWEEGASYEWDVTTFDKYGVASPPSEKAKFTYIVDVNALIGVPMYAEPLVIGNTINKKALLEIRTKLYDEVRKYRNMDPAEVLTLFNGEVVPSKSDMDKLKNIINQMLTNDGVSNISGDLIDGTLGISDIVSIRDQLVAASMSPPDQPAGGTAAWTDGRIDRPVSILAKNDSTIDTTIQVSWSPSERTLGGWIVDLAPSNDTDINYYKFFNEEVRWYLDSGTSGAKKSQLMLNEVYIKSEQITNGTIFVPYTGLMDSHKMYYTSHDMNGRSCPALANVTFTSNIAGSSPSVLSYTVQYQQRSWTTNQPNPEGTWYSVYTGASTSFVHTVSAEGSYWYRVRANLSNGTVTDWTYSVNDAIIKY